MRQRFSCTRRVSDGKDTATPPHHTAPPATRKRRTQWLALWAAAGALALLVAASSAELLMAQTGPVAAERLLIQYRSGSFQLLSRTPLTKVLPPSDELPASKNGVSGFWFEVQTAKGEVKYRRIAHTPLVAYTEVPDPAQPGLPQRAEAVVEEKVFAVLIPQFPGSNNLVLVSSPLSGAEKAQPAQTLGRIPLAEVSK